MGNADCKTQCKSVGIDCQADGVVEEKSKEVVDVTQFETQVAGAVHHPEDAANEGGAKKGSEGKRRPAFDVTLERTGKHWRNLGMLVSPDDDPRHLLIDDIWEPSLISEWNASHGEDQKVKAGDIITCVNDSQCNGEEMLSKIQALGKGASIRLRVE